MAPTDSNSLAELLGVRRWARASMRNAIDLARAAPTATSFGATPYEVVAREGIVRLRRYGSARGWQDEKLSAPLLLVPPLMVSADIYDVSPEQSAVKALLEAHVDVWVVDFGAPEREPGGMRRTLDDHVRAVALSARRAREMSGRSVHLAGYSQGGMFAYQAAAYLGGDAIASIITLGSPVDIHQNLPNVPAQLAGALIQAASPLVTAPLRHLAGVPGGLTSLGFKLMTPRKELEQLVSFMRNLHDRQALERQRDRRRFLAGEGFVAWPGPALQRFVEDIVVHNRMMTGGLVIDDKPVSLGDIHCPILYLVGTRDEFARPASVRAIRQAAPAAEIFELLIEAGHFGLAVGSASLKRSWPTIAAWAHWRDGHGDMPPLLKEPVALELGKVRTATAATLRASAAGSLRRAWQRLGQQYEGGREIAGDLKTQLPRLRRLEHLFPDETTSPAKALAAQAAAHPDRTFFFWRGRAYRFGAVNALVERLSDALEARGVVAGSRVALYRCARPSALALAFALNRLGAVAVMTSPGPTDETSELLRDLKVAALICPAPHAKSAQGLAGAGALWLVDEEPGGLRFCDGPAKLAGDGSGRAHPPFRRNHGKARDLAFILVRARIDGQMAASRISNGRWAMSALGISSAAALTDKDTVYCCLPACHPTTILVATGAALVAGARLALGEHFQAESFWPEVRRYGVSVVFYAGDMLEPLLRESDADDARSIHPVRLFAGSGMRRPLWRKVERRWGAAVLELYASTEHRLILANTSGTKVGSVGRPLPGCVDLLLARCDFATGQLVRSEGEVVRCRRDEPGVAMLEVSERAPGDEPSTDGQGRFRHYRRTGAVMRLDGGGDYWFVDHLAGLRMRGDQLCSSRRLEDALAELGGLRGACAYPGRQPRDGRFIAVVAAAEPLDPERVQQRLLGLLSEAELPKAIYRVAELPFSDGFRPQRRALAELIEQAIDCLQYDAGCYRLRGG